MKAIGIGFVVGLLLGAALPTMAAPERPDAPSTTPVPSAPQDGMRPEDVMIDGEIVGDVWDTASPAAAMGITTAEANILPSLTSGVSSAQLLEERELYRAPQPESTDPPRLPTERWRPAIPVQTLFYLGLAVVIVAVLFLKARG